MKSAKQVLLAFCLLFLSLSAHVSASPSGSDKKDLQVSINVNYSPPSSFLRLSPYYRAGSAITLTCAVEGVRDGLFYEWRSDCDGACFVLGASTQSVSKLYLESKDSGTHTCVVYDGIGCSGNANTTIRVVGAGIYVNEGQKSLSDDDIIVADRSSNRISEFRCLSGTSRFNVGHFIGTNGTDIINDRTDPFYITRGGKFSPGMIQVRSSQQLGADYEGVYTCRIPDENGGVKAINVGLYRNSTAGPSTMSKMGFSISEPPYTVTCNSTGSPPTKVVWTFNGKVISTADSDVYKTSKKLINRHTSSYTNVLTIDGQFEDIVGEYSCKAENQLGNSSTITKEIKGLYITGNDKPIIVGLQKMINCSTHLNVSKMEWILVGIQDDPVEQTTDSQSLTLMVNPKTAGLNGAMFTCRAVTAGGKVFEETITIQVKELDNLVTISGRENPLISGDNYTIGCTVVSDIIPSVKWMDADKVDIKESRNIIIEEPVTSGNTTLLSLTFSPLSTSHGGVYYCQSTVEHPSSVEQASREIIVKIPPPSVSIVRSPSDELLYTTTQLNITCVAEVHNIDESTEVQVNSSWTGPGPLNSSRISVSNSSNDLVFNSNLHISSIQSSDSGDYTCTITALSPSLYVQESEAVVASTNLRAALKVSIEVSYTPPDQYPNYSPPAFRAASSVTLRCVVEGSTGSISYRWTSTCRSCFASSRYSSTISEQFLRSKDAGLHTCTVTDGAGNTGSYSQQMNITGAGIYVSTAASYGGSVAFQPNNTFVQYHTSRSLNSKRFSIYCCSGSTSSSVGSFTNPHGSVRTSNYDYYTITRHSSSNSYAGCIHMESRFSTSTRTCISRSYYGSCREYRYNYDDDGWTPTHGVYTCNIPDENGAMQHIGFTLSSSSSSPSIRTMYRDSSTDVLTVVCRSWSAPPTKITWSRDGQTIVIDGKTNHITQQVTSRTSVIYENKLQVFSDLDNATGVYKCTITNKNQYPRSRSLTIRGIQLSSSTPPSLLVVGQRATFRCSSDLDPTSVTWYLDDSLDGTSTSQITLNPVSTDDEGKVYRCEARSRYGTQERNITLSTRVPDNWATVEAVSDKSNRTALHGSNYNLTCTVTVIDGIKLPINIEWVHSNGSAVVGDNTTRVSDSVKMTNTSETISVFTLKFNPVLTTDGGSYTCRATVMVPWMDVQPTQITATVHMPVTTQALFQLKMGPVQYCVNWNADETYDLETNVKQNIKDAIRKRCDCDFESSAIYSGEFSCQTSTTSVTYRAIINGTSDLLTAPSLIGHIENWRKTSGTLLHDKFRLRLAKQEECPLEIESFDELECSGTGRLNSTLTECLQADRYYKLSG